MKKLICLLLCLCMLIPAALVVGATEKKTAEDISKSATVTGKGYTGVRFITDKNTTTFHTSDPTAEISFDNTDGIGSIYIIMNFEYGEIIVRDKETGEEKAVDSKGILHFFIDVEKLFGRTIKSASVKFESGAVTLSEIYIFSSGKAPDFVQIWQDPHEGGADLVLFSTHGDDEQLFFAGLLPLYAGEKGLRVQVVYLTDHRNMTNGRVHEMLNGLWAVGVKAYPVFGGYADQRTYDLEGTYKYYEGIGVSRDELQQFVVEQIRRFKPMVAVGHDINGEYGHGMHMMYTDLLIKALDLASDRAQFTESYMKYGAWKVPKTYLHLYGENKITMNYDTPLESFDGLTAFQVSQQLGYPCHLSQQYTWFTDWINGKNVKITKAAQITDYNPAEFGLYRSEVGPDTNGNDMFEGVMTYAQQEEEEKRLEELKKQEEEAARLEEEKKKEEAASKETVADEPQTENGENEIKPAELPKELIIGLIAGGGAVLIGMIAVVATAFAKARRKRRRRANYINRR